MKIGSGNTSAAALAIASLVYPFSAAAYHFEDSLRGSTKGNQIGGTLTPDGWRVDGISDRIWYSMPTLPVGSIEFSLSGVSNDRFEPLDHEMFTLYEGGYGLSEPVDYGHLKPLFYRVMWRIRGEVAGVNGETVTHQGEQKLIWIMCPDGAPGYGSGEPFCKCSQWLDEGPTGGDMAWSGAPERIRFEWDENGARYLRNGTVVDTIDWTGTGLMFAPSEPHFCLGSPRAGAVAYAVTIVGAVYSDLVVDGIEGSQGVCPGTAVDAGTPDTGVADGGSAPGVDHPALQDVTGASWEPGVYSVVTDLNAEGPNGGAQGSVVYLKFPPVGGTPQKAVLKLHTSNIAGAGGGSGKVCRVDDDSWNENTLTWANRPPVSGVCVGTSRTVDADQEVEFDVTSIVGGFSNENLAIVSADPDGVHYHSKESGGGTLGPRLHVEIQPGSDAGVADAAADTGAIDAGPADTGDLDSAAAVEGGGAADAGGGEDVRPALDTGGAESDSGAAADTGSPGAANQKDSGDFSYDTVGCGCTTIGAR